MEKLTKLVKSKKLLYLGIIFLLFFIPLYPKFPLVAVSDTYVSVRLEDIFVALLVTFFAIWLLLNREVKILRLGVTRLIILYLVTGLLSVFSGIWITKNIIPHLAFLHLLRRAEYISLFFVAYYSFSEIKQLKNYGWATFISALGVIFYGLGQKFFGWPVVSTMNKEFSKGMILKLTWWARINSTFAGHYDLAAYMAMILSLVVVSFMITKNWREKILITLGGLFSYYLLILTASRISFAAYLVSVFLVLLISKRKLLVFPFLVFSILGMVFSADLGQRYAATFKINLSFLSGMVKVKPRVPVASTLIPTPTLVVMAPVVSLPPKIPTLTPTPPGATPSTEYFEPTDLAVGRSTDIRLKVEWPRAARAFLKNPLLGTGYSSITLASDNDYLRMLGETGILGSLAFFAIILELFRQILLYWRGKCSSKEGKLIILGITGSSLAFFLNATFIDVFEASKIAFFYWILMGLALRIVNLETQAKNQR